ncbi:hypothetical protein EII33_03975 [Bacteroides heparinolyticus]|uniref:BACON domain-containing protein n=2 Tax=Bacteroidales TaxID=171549 RepID=A0A3P2AFQ4_9BACE|nr:MULTISPECIES: BACON domain-containing protein [Bacteroidales]RRD92473.1 hypothetical protein EII33_03975 [Bacteroides heparinolyticus]
MNKNGLVILFCLMAISIVSCKKTEIGFLKVDVSEVILTSSSSNQSFKVESNEAWEIDGENRELLIGGNAATFGWVLVSPFRGNSSKEVTLQLADTEKPTNREQITLKIIGNSGMRTITVRYRKEQ